MIQSTNLPYFDGILERLAVEDPKTVAAFGRHVHWGYWRDPDAATGSGEDYGDAAEALCQAVCNAGEVRDGMRILDVGCGFGGTLASLNERFSGLQLVGVNIDPRQLERASELVRPRSGNTVEFLHADAANIPLPDNSFDVVLAVECVFHFDRLRFFSEVRRLLVDIGSLSLSDFVPTDRAVEYLKSFSFFVGDEVIQGSYGDADLSYSLNRYRDLAGENELALNEAIDITENTLPTYRFLYETTTSWPDAPQKNHFLRATKMLEKACRIGILQYQILQFSKAQAARMQPLPK